MKKYAYVRFEEYSQEERLFDTETEAIAYAETMLNHLTFREQEKVLYLAVVYGETLDYDDDTIDMDAAEVIKEYIDR